MSTKTLLLFVIIVLFYAVDGQQIRWDPLNQFPVSHGWPPKKWNEDILEWGYTNLEQLKNSAYRSVNNSYASIFNRAFAASARTMTIFSDCLYDTWVATSDTRDKPVSGVRIVNHFRRFTRKEQVEALNYAAYTALYYNFGYLGTLFQTQINATLVRLGYSLKYVAYNKVDKPYGIGVRACQLITAKASRDGSNQDGLNIYSDQYGVPFSDYTNYRPPQDGQPILAKTNCDTLRYIDSWQPVRSRVAVGSNLTQVRPWFDVVFSNLKPFAIPCSNSFRPEPVAKNITTTRDRWVERNTQMLQFSSNLGDYEKATANYYQGAEGYTGILWSKFVTLAAQKKKLNIEQIVKLYFFHSHSVSEVYLVQYEGKRFYNAPRPPAPIQCLFRNQEVGAWKGPYQGVGVINGSNWTAYLSDIFVNNQTPEYPCGHCIMSGATQAALTYYFKSDKFIGEPITYLPGSFIQEPKLTSEYFGYVAGVTDVPNSGKATVGYAPAQNLTLSWSTWTQVTQEASTSRLYLGVHYPDSEKISYSLGQNVTYYLANFVNKNYFKIRDVFTTAENDGLDTDQYDLPV